MFTAGRTAVAGTITDRGVMGREAAGTMVVTNTAMVKAAGTMEATITLKDRAAGIMEVEIVTAKDREVDGKTGVGVGTTMDRGRVIGIMVGIIKGMGKVGKAVETG